MKIEAYEILSILNTDGWEDCDATHMPNKFSTKEPQLTQKRNHQYKAILVRDSNINVLYSTVVNSNYLKFIIYLDNSSFFISNGRPLFPKELREYLEKSGYEEIN